MKKGEQKVIRLTVTPAAEPIPAFRHRLVARDIDLQPGNAAPFYYRALLEIPPLVKRMRDADDPDRASKGCMHRWRQLHEIPLETVRKAGFRLDWLIDQQLNTATSRRQCDWQFGIEDLQGFKVYNFVLPEIQQMRELCGLVALHTRLAIADGRLDDALDAIRMNYRIAGDAATTRFLVCCLVGTAVARIVNETLIELIAARGSPNLYWALTELPNPLIDLGPAFRFESEIRARVFPFIQESETTQRSYEEWNRLFRMSWREIYKGMLEGRCRKVTPLQTELTALATALAGYPHAKRQLVAEGMDAGRVDEMPVGQVLAAYSERNCERLRDEWKKLFYMPFWEYQAREPVTGRELNEAADPFSRHAQREVLPMASALLFGFAQYRVPQVRLQREIAALRLIEALRMYAAEHGGRLPTSLDEVTRVPLPMNPATGQPFDYTLEDGVAVLEMPRLDRHESERERFEIVIAQ
ncbi:MAG: hypothetical protein WD738_11675 [Pirellulales bacterium]